jgi:hypothetical protein
MLYDSNVAPSAHYTQKVIMITGFDVIVTPDLPKMKLAQGDYVTPAFRQEIDEWLLSFFGTTNFITDGNTIVSEVSNKIWMNPRTYVNLRRVAA